MLAGSFVVREPWQSREAEEWCDGRGTQSPPSVLPLQHGYPFMFLSLAWVLGTGLHPCPGPAVASHLMSEPAGRHILCRSVLSVSQSLK